MRTAFSNSQMNSQNRIAINWLVHIRPSVLMNRISDADITRVLGISLKRDFARHLCLNRKYHLFSECFCPLICGQSRTSILEPTPSRLLRSNVEPAGQSGMVAGIADHHTMWAIIYIRWSAELWWFDDPEVSALAERRQKKLPEKPSITPFQRR
jgi:hypothetical protein